LGWSFSPQICLKFEWGPPTLEKPKIAGKTRKSVFSRKILIHDSKSAKFSHVYKWYIGEGVKTIVHFSKIITVDLRINRDIFECKLSRGGRGVMKKCTLCKLVKMLTIVNDPEVKGRHVVNYPNTPLTWDNTT
jgi:hypothetical protein